MIRCQSCGHEIKGKPYYWDDDSRLPMHPDLTQCGPGGSEAFAAFMNRNAEYINRRGPPVLLGREARNGNGHL